MSDFVLAPERIASFEADGYIVVPGLFDSDEMGLLRDIGKADEDLRKGIRTRRDASGGVTTLSLSNDLGDDIYSAIVRCHRIVDPMERLLGGEVYHYHHKMNM